jgi:hypothetical protein
MYKPNGEEPMTKQEEARRRAALTERTRKELKQENLHPAFYAALFGVSSSSEETVGASFTQAQ